MGGGRREEGVKLMCEATNAIQNKGKEGEEGGVGWISMSVVFI